MSTRKYPKDFINKIICGDWLEIHKEIPNSSIDLIVTSPPYFMFKEYESFSSYGEYLDFLNKAFLACAHALKPGRHLVINIDDAHRTLSKDGNECLPTHAHLISYICSHHNIYKLRFKETVIWNKIRSAHQRGDGKNVLYGSYPYPNGIPIKNNVEYVLVFAKWGKPKYPSKEIKEKSRIDWDFFVKYGSSPWRISAERNRQHPAPYPEKFASTCIKLYSFKDDIVLDPLLGSGTTARVAKDLKRNFIGIEINPDYCKIAEERLAQGVL